MGLFRRNNYNTKRDVEETGLAALLRTYGSVGGANARVEQLSRKKASDAERSGLPSIVARIYAPTTLDIAPQPFEANSQAQAVSMVERIYERSKPGDSK
jgi:hypothetical protein